MVGEKNAALPDDAAGWQNVDLPDDAAGKQPWIEVKIFYHKGALYILVKNSYLGDVIREDNGFVTTKESRAGARHGLGLKSVGRIVRSHSGGHGCDGGEGSFLREHNDVHVRNFYCLIIVFSLAKCYNINIYAYT